MRDPRSSLVAAALRRFAEDGMVDRAPALAYYGILSLFPMLLIAFSLVRLAGDAGVPDELAEFARDGGSSGAVAEALRSAADTARAASAETAGSAGLAGLLALIYGASRAFTAGGRALDAIADRTTPRRSLRRRLQDILWTLVVVGMIMALLLVVVISGSLLTATVGLLGLDDQLDTWRIVRWPAAIAIATLMVAVVRYAAPSARPPFRILTPGVMVTVGAIAVETVGYNVYVTTIATYNATYGAFAGAIILMLWIWLAAIAFLFGAELDAAHEERRGAHPTAGGWRPGLPGSRTDETVGVESKAP